MDHRVDGKFSIDDVALEMVNGKGYLEKDWGFNFPRNWIWLQSNHFAKHPSSSLFLSIASVPWRSFSFPGFLVGFWHDGQLRKFCSYTGATFKLITANSSHVHATIENNEEILEIVANRRPGALIWGPRDGRMQRFVEESVSSSVEVKLFSKIGTEKKVLFEDTGFHSGLEVVGNMGWFFENL